MIMGRGFWFNDVSAYTGDDPQAEQLSAGEQEQLAELAQEEQKTPQETAD
ncbi:hypothetical protein ACFYXC_29185 [Streptomyces sp. NPDC002701]